MSRPAKPMTPGPTAEELLVNGSLSFDDAAAFCGVSRRAINYAVARGELKAFHHKSKPLIPRRALVLWQAAEYEAEHGAPART